MRLLIVTQVLDEEHPVLGFFCRWVNRFAEDYEQITVICLQKGSAALAQNVRVHSLGKEQGRVSPGIYVFRFLKLLFSIDREYDRVLVHMNPEYFLIAGWWWRLRGRFSALWYVHHHAGLRLRIAELFANRFFYTSPFGAAARSKKSVRMPAGIDTTIFFPQPVKKVPHSVYFQGRVTSAKRVHILLGAVERLVVEGLPVRATIVGPHDPPYVAELTKRFEKLIDSGAVTLLGSVPNTKTPELFSMHWVSVNLTAAGNYDKAVNESIACGTPAIVASPAFATVLDERWIIGEPNEERLAVVLKDMLTLPEAEYTVMAAEERARVEETESLAALADRFFKEMTRGL